MVKKLITQEEQTQIGLIIDMLERLEGKVDLAEAARHEREINESALLTKLDHTVFGNGKRGLVQSLQSAADKITIGIWLFVGIFSIVLADFVKHYLP